MEIYGKKVETFNKINNSILSSIFPTNLRLVHSSFNETNQNITWHEEYEIFPGDHCDVTRPQNPGQICVAASFLAPSSTILYHN